jgi:hypothetical protein
MNENEQELCIEYESLIHSVIRNSSAGKFITGPYQDTMEYSICCEAMVNAIRDYDSEKGMSLKSYVYMKMQYRLVDYMRRSIGRKDRRKRPRITPFTSLGKETRPADILGHYIDNFQGLERIDFFNTVFSFCGGDNRVLVEKYFLELKTPKQITKEMGWTDNQFWGAMVWIIKTAKHKIKKRREFVLHGEVC